MLLHGYLSSKESFYYQIKFLSRHFRVYAPDMPGFGKSEPIPYAYSVGDYASWLLNFLKAANIKSCAVLAHSFGARVAFKAFSQSPCASALIITGGAGVVKPRSKEYLKSVQRYRRVKKIFPRLAEKIFGSGEYKSLSPVMRESYKKIVNEDLRACAAQITCPTYLLYGKDDVVTPPSEEGEIFKNAVKGSVLETMEGGHFCFSEHPEEFNGRIFAFLREH